METIEKIETVEKNSKSKIMLISAFIIFVVILGFYIQKFIINGNNNQNNNQNSNQYSSVNNSNTNNQNQVDNNIIDNEIDNIVVDDENTNNLTGENGTQDIEEEILVFNSISEIGKIINEGESRFFKTKNGTQYPIFLQDSSECMIDSLDYICDLTKLNSGEEILVTGKLDQFGNLYLEKLVSTKKTDSNNIRVK